LGMKAPVTTWETTVPSRWIEWADVKDRVDLGIITTALLGPAPGRRGQQGRGLWWSCPFHQDKNPSFHVDSRRGFWKCYGCSEYGDAASLVMRLRGTSFPDSVRWLAEQSNLIAGPKQSQSKNQEAPVGEKLLDFKPSVSRDAAEHRSGIPVADALTLVESSAIRLWSITGATALSYLRSRGLDDETIKAARLGVVPTVAIPKKNGNGTWNASGITIPWFDGDRLVLVKVRQPDCRTPKYGEAFRDRPTIYPAPSMVQVGKPVVICEGEFDALLLGQQIGDMVHVITLGSASNRPLGPVLDAMLAAPTWYLALDGDQAGDKSAAAWPARARRIRPPDPHKDWGEVHQAGRNLIRYIWGGILPRAHTPWEVLETVRWGMASQRAEEPP
jgi:hypothetical protein